MSWLRRKPDDDHPNVTVRGNAVIYDSPRPRTSNVDPLTLGLAPTVKAKAADEQAPCRCSPDCSCRRP